MKTDLELAYKAETGNSAFIEKESKHLTESIDATMLSDMSKSEIIDLIKYDYDKTSSWGLFISELPKEYRDGNDLKIYDPEYVQWLENKIKQKP